MEVGITVPAGDQMQHEVSNAQSVMLQVAAGNGMNGLHHTSAVATRHASLSSRKRSRCKSGPEFRIAPLEDGAVATAIKSVQRRPGEPVFCLRVSMSFSSSEEALEFFNLYSWEVGFGVRLGRSHRNSSGYRTMQEFVCSCEGTSSNSSASSIRTGCKVMLRLLRSADHGWYVSSLQLSHNHEVSKSCGEKKQWNSHSKIDPLTKDFIRKLRENNISLGRVCSVLGVNSNRNGLPIRKQVVRSACARIAQDNIKDDIGKTLTLLEDMKRADPGMVVSFDLDSEGRIQSMLWCSGKNRLDYSLFGDVVTFDTTYRTNLYNMPFGLFVGVNNHFQSVIFGRVLLTHERTEDFEWAFGRFISIMDGKAPLTVLTDQCQAMAAALKTTIPSARHRWCRWHVLRHAKQKIGTVYSSASGFKKEFHKLVTFETCKSIFERRWRMLMRKHNLRENKFVKHLFKRRMMWAKPYFMDVFCAGMTSTQRSESANHMLKGYIQRSAPMHLFVAKFNEFLFDRKEAEERENHVTRQVKRKQSVRVPIEIHAREVYTDAIYQKFLHKLFLAGRFIISARPCKDQFVLVDSRFLSLECPRKVSVRLQTDGTLVCDCGLFEHMGLLCKHALKVLVHLDRMVLPASNIKARWTRGYSAAVGNNHLRSEQNPSVTHCDPYLRKKVVMNRLADFVSKQDGLGDLAFLEAMRVLDNLDAGVMPSVAISAAPAALGLDSSQPIPSHCPAHRPRAGRPQSCSNKSAAKHVVPIKDDVSRSSTDVENPRGGKTRGIGDLMRI